jgi:hypothetical protein
MGDIKSYIILLFTTVIIFSINSCRDNPINNGTPDLPAPTFASELLFSPIDIDKIEYVEPLGCVNPPGHTFPTDHVYFYYNLPTVTHKYQADYTLPVYAPASGRINFVLMTSGPGYDTKIMVQVNASFTYYLDHIILDSGLVLNSMVTAGQRVGITGYAYAIDLGIVNTNITLPGLINPARYGYTMNTDSPYKYYQEPLKSRLYALMNRISADKDGKIDYDIKGRLIGNWFHESVKIEDSNGPLAWPKSISFAPDSYDPTQMIVACGGYIGVVGKFKASLTDPDPSHVSVTSGKVVYHLISYFNSGTPNPGIFVAQVLDDLTMKVEFFKYPVDDGVEFDSLAQIYSR